MPFFSNPLNCLLHANEQPQRPWGSLGSTGPTSLIPTQGRGPPESLGPVAAPDFTHRISHRTALARPTLRAIALALEQLKCAFPC